MTEPPSKERLQADQGRAGDHHGGEGGAATTRAERAELRTTTAERVEQQPPGQRHLQSVICMIYMNIVKWTANLTPSHQL